MLPKIPIVRLSNSVGLPFPSYTDSVGTSMLLFAANSEVVKIDSGNFATIPTGFACALPLGMEAQVRSLKDSGKTGVVVLNAPLTFDASDREEIMVCLFNASGQAAMIKRGQPIALMVFAPAVRILWDNKTPNESSPQYTFRPAEYSPEEDDESSSQEDLVPLDYQETAPYFKEEKEEEKLYDEEEAIKLQNEVDEDLRLSDNEIEMSVSSSHDESAFLQPESETPQPFENNEVTEPTRPDIEQTSPTMDEQPSDEKFVQEDVTVPDIPSVPDIPDIEEDK